MKLYPRILSTALLGFSLSALAAPTNSSSDIAEILRGVGEIDAPGVPGGVCAFGPEAFALITGKDGKKAALPVAAAAHWEKGRIVALGHNGYLGAFADQGTGALLTNAARWVAGGKADAKIGVAGQSGLAGYLRSAGLNVVPLEVKELSGRLGLLNVVIVDAHKLTASDVEPLGKFVRSGGGLITAATGWGWLYGGKDKALLATEFPGNLLLKNAGLVFTAGTPDKTTARGYTATDAPAPLLNAGAALEAVTAQAKGGTALTADQLAQCSTTLGDALRSLPPDDQLLLPRLASLTASARPEDFPTPGKPLGSDQALARLLVTQQLESLRQAKPGAFRALPAAAAFPGAVPPNAPRINRRAVNIDLAVPAWQSTGLYAAPGEVIRVEVPPEMAKQGLAIRIGCHTDTLWHLESWQRAPEVSRREIIKQSVTEAANPFGGLIYIDVPEKLSPTRIVVTVSGAVEAPYFVLGQTSLLAWKNRLRNSPAPWAELATSKLILSVPSEKIRQLDDPEALMKFWDQVLDADADLIGIPRERRRPERIVPDVQISAGYMHSGYPIMTPLDKSVETSLSLELMKAGSWGHFHELGHNHQQADWTFDGTVEVTCNLFSLYCMETLCGKPPGTGHDAMKPEAVDKRLRGYFGMSDKFERWKKDPFLALTMYNQLRAGFGWATYQKVFAEYRDLPKAERPKNDAEKHDQWLVRFSRTSGKNLGPFFEAWGLPTSAEARKSIEALPAWMPADWPK